MTLPHRFAEPDEKRCILIQGQVRPRLIVVASVRFRDPAQMCLAQDKDVVRTFTPDRGGQDVMSAMGHLRTCPAQDGMSASPPESGHLRC